MVLKEEEVYVTSGKKKGSVRKETNAVSGMRVTIVRKNQNPEPPHLLSHRWHEVEARREKEASEAEGRLAEFFDNRVDTIWKVLAGDHLVIIGILPNLNSIKLNRDAKQGTSVCSRTTRLKNNQVKSRKRAFKTETVQWRQGCWSDCENCTTIGLCLARLRAIRTSEKSDVPGKPEAEGFWDQFDEFDSNSLRYVKQVSGKRQEHRLEKYKSKYLLSEVPTLLNLRTDPRKRLKDTSDAPVARHGTCQKTLSKKDFNSAEWETVRISKKPTTVMTANGEVQA